MTPRSSPPSARDTAAAATLATHHVRRLLEQLALLDKRADSLLERIRALILDLHKLTEALDAEAHKHQVQEWRARRDDLKGRGGPGRGGGRPRG